MARHVVAVLSDPHLSGKRAYALPGWRDCVGRAREASPALTVALGDHVLDDPDDAEDQGFARAALEAPGPAHVAVPGNHDVGDNGDQPYLGQAVTPDRLARWRAANGEDRFVRPLGNWWLVGVNAQLLGTGLPEEEDAWVWLEGALRAAGSRPVALFTHKPLLWRGPDDADRGSQWPATSRKRLEGLPGAERLTLVVSGHLHQHRVLVAGGVTHLWCPSTGLPGRDHGFGSATDRRPGFTLMEFDGDRVSFAVLHACAEMPDVPALMAAHGPLRAWPPFAADAAEPRCGPAAVG